ncbi:bacteriophage protein gp37 [Mycobacteroides abscessus subsp. abscessus]|uniref:DUF5131 family protein n=1 Tax=Mycobacteroides abscessus TaxID=36809 RepID=UPI0009271478|nr:DUF5131 family protein [Mycobacteroides abscessus]SHX95875.1 bacteriophage protein gp37 [Mycobacteroides abscessus subsp. abscessus]SIC76589.1 bacteriophage protein gp37 [Mycobacteroides abscessus subsp. abscessus]SKP28298.1 bacteriophage protein gp37 [Mycobacteroides abscessus subsp. abscessus]
MTAREGKNNARKQAIRELQQANPDLTYLEAGALLDTGTEGLSEYDAIANGFDVKLNFDKLDFLLPWTTPRQVRLSADLFDDKVTDYFIAERFAMMACNYLWDGIPAHTFQLVTTHPDRMQSLLSSEDFRATVASIAGSCSEDADDGDGMHDAIYYQFWPLPNVWLGATIQDQQQADRNIPVLLETPASVRYVYVDQPRGPIDLVGRLCRDCMRDMEAPQCDKCYDRWWVRPRRSNRIDWVITGGGTGPEATPLHLDWVLSLRDQCVAADVPFFFTGWGEFGPSGDPAKDQRYLVHHDGISATFNGAAVTKPGIGQRFAYRLGADRAGRILDGRTWDQYPDKVIQ